MYYFYGTQIFVQHKYIVFILFHVGPEYWYQQAKIQLRKNLKDVDSTAVARNIILFIGDGMGLTTVTAARILRGQQNGQTGEENELAFDKFQHVALAKVRLTNVY